MAEAREDLLYIEILSDKATLPTKGSKFAAGFDLYSAYDFEVPPYDKAISYLDLKIQVPHGTYGRIAPRSGLALRAHVGIGAGVLDEDYRGNVGVLVFNHGSETLKVKAGDRIAQLICERISNPEIKIVEKLNDTMRGEGGFGSTG